MAVAQPPTALLPLVRALPTTITTNHGSRTTNSKKLKKKKNWGTLSEAAGTVSASVDEEKRGQPTVDGEESRIDNGAVDIWGEEKEG